MEDKKELLDFIDKLSVFILGFFFIIFPLAFSPLTTDAFSLPKQIVLALGVFATLLLLGARFFLEGSVKLRRTPFDLPVILFAIVTLISSVLAVNQSDAIQTFVPLFLAVLLFFAITNTFKRDRNINFLAACLSFGALILSAITILSYLKIYVLPFAFARSQTFSPFGSLFDQAIYLAIALSVCFYFAYPSLKERSFTEKNGIIFGVFGLAILAGFVVSLLSAIKYQSVLTLPFETGFQTALSAISQDSGRVLKGLLLGSGPGTYFTDFTRFKPATFNLNDTLWTISFFRSSSFILELLATVGVLGIASYLFLAYRAVKIKPVFIPAVITIALSFIVPFSFTSLVLLFGILGLLSTIAGLGARDKSRFFDIELHLVAFKKGIFALSEPESRETSSIAPKILSGGALLLMVLLTIAIGYYMTVFTLSDLTFQKSFVALNNNNGSVAYDSQAKAISYFSARDGYHRIFSQLNLSLANNIASSIPKGASPSATQQQTIYTLIQQSINSGRQATTISPQTVTNWQNLSGIYRSLIGFGQNADTFAILAAQQAIVLDPNNPQEYITLGGIFYQLGQWDSAIRQFQTAATLKSNFSNAYYNLGHAYEQKGDLKAALVQYQTVKTLVAKDKVNNDKIISEIAALQAKIDQVGASQQPQAAGTGTSINAAQPQLQLPPQPSPVKIPAPSIAPTPIPTPSPSPTPPAPSLAK